MAARSATWPPGSVSGWPNAPASCWDEIVPSIQKTSELVQEIAGASRSSESGDPGSMRRDGPAEQGHAAERRPRRSWRRPPRALGQAEQLQQSWSFVLRRPCRAAEAGRAVDAAPRRALSRRCAARPKRWRPWRRPLAAANGNFRPGIEGAAAMPANDEVPAATQVLDLLGLGAPSLRAGILACADHQVGPMTPGAADARLRPQGDQPAARWSRSSTSTPASATRGAGGQKSCIVIFDATLAGERSDRPAGRRGERGGRTSTPPTTNQTRLRRPGALTSSPRIAQGSRGRFAVLLGRRPAIGELAARSRSRRRTVGRLVPELRGQTGASGRADDGPFRAVGSRKAARRLCRPRRAPGPGGLR